MSAYKTQILDKVHQVCLLSTQANFTLAYGRHHPCSNCSKHKRLFKHLSVFESIKLNVLSRKQNSVFLNYLGKSYFFCNCIFVPSGTQTENLAQEKKSKSALSYSYKRQVLEVLSSKGALLSAVGLFICMSLFILKRLLKYFVKVEPKSEYFF